MTLRTHAGDLSFFEGVPLDELARFLDGLEHRTYPAGAVVVAEGDRTREIYLPQRGSAEVFVSDNDGSEHRVGRVVPGGTVGEISVLTGQPAVATVRATSELQVIVMTEDAFTRFAATYPRVYRNMGTILAERLARTDRLVVGHQEGRLVALEDTGSPPLLGYALASSIAWHTHERTLLLLIDDDPPQELLDLATTSIDPPWRSGRGAENVGADLLVASPTGYFAPDKLVSTIEALFGLFKHVLVQSAPGTHPAFATAVAVQLAPEHGGNGSAPEASLTIRGWTRRNSFRPDADRIVGVPKLVAEDESALREAGILPSTTAAGKAIGWAARDLTGLKVGVALGAGSIRGYAHIGVIEVLRGAGLEFDYLAGTSVGAAVAGLYALGNDTDRIADILDEFSPNLFRVKVPYRSLLSDRGMRSYLRNMAPHERIEDLTPPLALIAADILTQKELVMRRGLLWQAVLASIAIPGVYPAQRIGPYVAVDGGVLNPVPANVPAEMGAGTVIAVKLGSAVPHPEHDFDVVPAHGKPPSALAVLMRSVEIMQLGITAEPTDATMITISPKLDPSGVSLRNMGDGRRYVAEGVGAAETALPRVAAALPWLR